MNLKYVGTCAAFSVAVLGGVGTPARADLVSQPAGVAHLSGDRSSALNVRADDLFRDVESPALQYAAGPGSESRMTAKAWRSYVSGNRGEEQHLAPAVFTSDDTPKGMFRTNRWHGNEDRWDFAVHVPDGAQRPFGEPDSAVARQTPVVPVPSALLLGVLGLGLTGVLGRRLP